MQKTIKNLLFLPAALLFAALFGCDWQPPPHYNEAPQTLLEYRKYLSLAENGDALGQYKTCLAYSFGRSFGFWGIGFYVKSDKNQAIFWCEKSAVQGFAKAQNWLGFMYMDYLPYEKTDYKKALYWLELAAAQNYGYSLFYLGQMYDYGLDVKPNLEQAIFYYKKAIDNGIFWAKHNIEDIQTKYKYFERDLLKAKKGYKEVLYELAEACIPFYRRTVVGKSAVGHPECVNALNWIFIYAEDSSLALTFMMRKKLGEFYFYGKHVAQDYVQAMHWLKLSLKPNKELGMREDYTAYLIGLMYEEGLGVAIDLEQAVYWYKLSNSPKAKEGLKRIHCANHFCFKYWLDAIFNFEPKLIKID